MAAGEVVLVGLVLWTLLGLVGSAVWLARGEGRRAAHGMRWVAGAWGVYLLVLGTVSWKQAGRVVPMRTDQCFGEMCFAVTGVEEMEGFRARGQSGARLLRVQILVSNRAKRTMESDARVRAYLLDAQGRRWEEVRGISGVSLRARVAAGDAAVSEPVFRVPKDATGLRLVLTHGRWLPGMLVIGDADSWMHKPTTVPLS